MIYLMMQKNGMGNQMFGYAYARYLLERYRERDPEEQLAINPYRFLHGDRREYIDERRCSLQHFRLNDEVRFLDEAEQALCNRRDRWQTRWAIGPIALLRRKLLHRGDNTEADYLRRSRRGVYESRDSRAYYPTVLSNARDKFVRGNFQDRRYFEPIRDILMKELEVRTEPSEANRRMLDRIRSVNAVCVHVRRGDYLDPHWAHLNICDREYYRRAIEHVLRSTQSPTFFLFSNTHADLEWVRENYRFADPVYGGEVHLEPVDLSNPDYEELRLMRACRHFIMPNSTFSWWAAYLSEQRDSVICAPDRWDLKYPGDAGMNCPSWTAIETGR